MTYRCVLRVSPGDGRLVRAERACLFVTGGEPSMLDELITRFERDPDHATLGEFVLSRNDDAPPFVLVRWPTGPGDGGLHVVVRGDVTITSDLPSLPRLSGVGSATWVEHHAPHAVPTAEFRVGPAPVDGTHLERGVVAAGGFALALKASDGDEPIEEHPEDHSDDTVVATTPAETTSPPSEPVPDAPPDVTDRLAALDIAARVDQEREDASPDPDRRDARPVDPAAEAPSDRPLTTARTCPAGHRNPPHRLVCERCGADIALDVAETTVPQPIVARLELPDGTLVDLDRSVVVGRNPRSDATRHDGDVHPVPLLAPASVSRTHLLVVVDGWSLSAVDCGSQAGSAVISADGEPVPLDAWTPYEVAPGDQLFLGGPTALTVREAR